MAKWNQISFAVTKHEAAVINEIADRAMGLGEARRHDRFTKMDIAMDVTAVHANGCPLRLEALLSADPFNFAHDVLGIRRNLNRRTGELENFWTPRYSA